jgi:hypothetical protein
MARLLTIMKEDPIEYTHFDCWTGGCDADEDDPFMTNEEHCEDIIKHWETSLGLTLHPMKRYTRSSFMSIYAVIGYEGVLDLVIMAILESGLYDVYSSDTCIEIYPTTDDEDEE